MQRVTTASNWAILLLATAALTACGGGGGGPVSPPVQGQLQLQVEPVVIGPAQSSATLIVRLAGLPANLNPVLLEADIVVDKQRLHVATSQPPLRALQPRPTLDGGPRGENFHVLYGDGQNLAGLPMAAGPLFSVTLELRTPRTPGVVAVEFANLRVVDALGDAVAVQTPVLAQVTIQ